ncbi:2-oxoacid:acceptor oxidoreductase family protein [Candidatus Calescamantes bacterium]|nr:2-oxoacid:acceptor oxidoreductase family protein [Candidatus Calescamantes bacterium]
MREEIIVAGFGGQGILFAGKLLTWAGLIEGKKVTCIPSYGAEMRGGTANCHVIISTQEISSPVVDNPTLLIVLNEQSLEKFLPRLREGGALVYNSSLIEKEITRKDVEIFSVPANELAEELGHTLLANMIILGALAYYKKVVELESLIKCLPNLLVGKEKFIEPNTRALRRGYEFARDKR